MKKPPENTQQEDAYIRSLEKRSPFESLDAGEAEVLVPEN
jgi:hypothetical protein